MITGTPIGVPQLLIAGDLDHIVSASVVNGEFKRYRKSPAVTDFHEFPQRGHSLVIDGGSRQVAEYIVTWFKLAGFEGGYAS